MTKLKLPLFCLLAFFFCLKESFAQDSSKFKLEGYVEAYLAFDNRKPQNIRYPFLTNFNRHNQVAINVASIKAKYKGDGIRANFGLQTGSFPIDNYRGEPNPFLSYIQEANVGIAFGKNKRLWLDAGVLPSYLGVENTNAFKNITLSRSLNAENSPYYLTGASLSLLSKNERWKFALWTTNGWGSITRVDRSLWYGAHIQYKGKSFEFNFGNLNGQEYRLNDGGLRIFNNVNLQWSPSDKIKLIGSADFGFQEMPRTSFNNRTWFAYSAMGQYKWTNKWATSLRFEYFDDIYGALGNVYQNIGLQTTGVSLNIDYAVRENALLRLEGRYFGSDYNQFIGNPNTTSIIASLAIRF